jgi:CO dehydrogenase maturation factor
VVILDMEAGIEHLGRATAQTVDKLIVVVEPGRRSIEAAYKIDKMAKDIGLQNIAVVGNKVKSQAEKDFIISSLPGFKLLGFIPYDQAVVDADLAERSVIDASEQVRAEVKNIYQALLSVDEASGSDKLEKTKIKK